MGKIHIPMRQMQPDRAAMVKNGGDKSARIDNLAANAGA